MPEPIATLYAEIRADTTELRKDLESLKGQLGASQKEFDGLSTAAGHAMTEMGSAAAGAGKALGGAGAALGETAEAAGAMQDAWTQLAQAMETERAWAEDIRKVRQELDETRQAGGDTEPVMQRLGDTMRKQGEAAAEVRKVRQEIDGVGKAAEAAHPPINNFGKVISMAMGAVSVAAVARLGVELVKVGAKAGALRQQFDALADNEAVDSMEAMRDAARGTVGDLELMTGANQLMKMGLAENSEELANIIEMSTQLKVPLEDVAMTMSNMSYLRLDTWGISAGATRQRVAELKEEQKGLSSEMAFALATTEQAEKLMGRLGDTTNNAAGDMERMTAQRENVKMLLGEIVSMGVEATGVIGTLNEGLRGLVTILEESKALGAETRALNAELTAMGESGALTAEQMTALTAGMDAGVGVFGGTREQVQAYTESLREAVMVGREFASEQELFTLMSTEGGLALMRADMEAMAQETLPTLQQGFSDFRMAAGEEFGALGDEMRLAMASFVTGDELASSLQQLSSLYGDHLRGIADIQQQYNDQIAEAEFQHQLEMVEAQAKHNAQRVVLLEASKTEEVAKLDAKFVQEQVQMEGAYSKQQLTLELSLANQRITEQQSYLASLQMQQDAMVKKMYMMALEAATADGIVTMREQGLLDIIKTGASEQLKAEIKKGEDLAKIEADIQSGSIKSAQITAQSIINIHKGEIAAGNTALNELEANRKATMDKLLAASQKAAADIGSGLGSSLSSGISRGISSGAKAAKKPATQALADVAKDIAGGIDAAAKAMQKLPGLLFTPEMEAGLDQAGLFLKAAARKAFEWLQEPEMKSMLEEVQDFHDEILAVFKMLDVDLSKVAPQGEGFGERADTWIAQLASTGWRLTKQLEAMASDTRVNLSLAASVVEDSKTIFSMLGIDLAGAVPDPRGWAQAVRDTDEWIKQLGSVGWRLITQLSAMASDTRVDLPKAASAVEDTKAIFSILSINFAGAVPDPRGWAQTVRDAEEWIKQLASVGWRLIKQLEAMAKDTRVSLPLATEAAESTQAIFEVLGVDFANAIPDPRGWAQVVRDMDGWIKQFGSVGWRLITQLEAMARDTRVNIDLAASISDNVGKMFKLLDIDFKLPTLADLMQTRLSWPVYFDMVQEFTAEMTAWLAGLNEGIRAQLSDVATTPEEGLSLVDQVNAVLGIYDFDPSKIKGPGKMFGATLREYLGAIELATDEAMPVLARLEQRWGAGFEIAAGTMANVQGLFAGIADIAQSMTTAIELGGVDTNSARALFQQMSALFDPAQGILSPGMQGLGATEGYPQWLSGLYAPAARQTVDVNIHIDDIGSFTRTIETASEADRAGLIQVLAEALFSWSGNQGTVRA